MSKNLVRKRLNKLHKELTKPKATGLIAIKQDGIIKWEDREYKSMAEFKKAISNTVIIRDDSDKPLVFLNLDHDDFEKNRNESLN